jgi:C1A family cysteine protease
MKTVELKSLFLSVMVIILSIYFSGSLSLAVQLDEVQAVIAAKGKSWIAGETSVSKLSDQEKKFRLGLIKQAMTGEEQVLSSEELFTAVPTSLDWRSNGGNFVTPVRNQGNCGSCWALSTTAALESYILIKDNRPVWGNNRAEQILLSCSGAGSCDGGDPSSAASYIGSTGLPPESYFRYEASDAPCTNANAGWENRTYKIASWSYVSTDTTSVDAIKSALYTYGPLSTTMDVYADFFYYKSGVYEYTFGSHKGRHAILIVGYADDPTAGGGGYFIVKNSWGTGWGSKGYFNIAYSQIGHPVYFGDWTIAYHQSFSTPPAAPTGLTATAASSRKINLRWSDNSVNKDGFRIERCTGSGCTNFAQIATVGAGVAAYNNTGLTANTSYSYRVSVYSGAASSAYSNTATATTFAAPQRPAAASSLSALPVSTTQIRLLWTDNSNNETGFKIERCQGSNCTNFTQVTTAGPDITTYLNGGLRRGTVYLYRVRSYNATGNSAYSNIVSTETLSQ